MSFYSATDANCEACSSAVELMIHSREADLGDFSVRRVLPVKERRSVGPFVFFDHMGPAEFPAGKGIAVRPHPHIGIATITFLFEGEIMHRDSLGVTQPITPGAVNLMVAGRGIVHSERAGSDLDQDARLHGIQSWIALPEELQEMDPAFYHFPAEQLPRFVLEGCRGTLILGAFMGQVSPVHTFSDTLYLEIELQAGSTFTLPDSDQERGVYLVEGSCELGGELLEPGTMAVLKQGTSGTLSAKTATRAMIIGGQSLGKRYIDWNFVSSSIDRIKQAKADWREDRFEKIEGDDEFIPLP